jgi:ribosomal protein L7/L12
MTLTIVLVAIIVVCAVVWAVARSKRPTQMRTLTDAEVATVKAKLRAGDRAGAIRTAREHTGMGLIQAREYVDHLPR